MHFLFTKHQDWLDKWDAFLQASPRGLYNQLSEWIKSYGVYGFDHNFLIAVENDKIIGGCGIVIAQFSGFKFFTVPSGPVLGVGHEIHLEAFISQLRAEAERTRCCYFQLSLPVCQPGFGDYALDQLPEDSQYFTGNEGASFKYVIPLQGMRLVDLRMENPYESAYKRYSSNNKRNLNKTSHAGLEMRFVTTDEAIAQCYDCFARNAIEKGYPLRSYAAMAKTLRAYIDKGHAKMAGCFHQGKIIGALYLMKCGGRLTYINGGVLKEFQHLNVSNFMHDQMIRHSVEEGYESYDLSVGGSRGVVQFKEGFGTQLYLYVPTRHWVLKPWRFRIFLLAEQYLKPHKTKIAGLLALLKKFKSKK